MTIHIRLFCIALKIQIWWRILIIILNFLKDCSRNNTIKISIRLIILYPCASIIITLFHHIPIWIYDFRFDIDFHLIWIKSFCSLFSIKIFKISVIFEKLKVAQVISRLYWFDSIIGLPLASKFIPTFIYLIKRNSSLRFVNAVM